MANDPPTSDYDYDDYPDSEDLASVVRVARNEDIAAICGRVDTAPTFAVVIHAPDGNRALATELGIRRVQRHAEDAGKMVAIATGSVSLASRARQAGIPVARRPQQVRWDAGGKRVIGLFGWSMRLPSIGRYVQYAFLLGAIAALIFGALAIGPSGKVVAYPPTDTLERLVTITADPEVAELDVDTLTVPATLVSTTSTLTLVTQTTGAISTGVRPARVNVTINNPSTQAVDLPAGAVLLTNVEGVQFALEEDVTIAAQATVSAPASAMVPGEIGNVAAGAITGFEETRWSTLAASNSSPAAQGANENRPAVNPQDLETLRALAAQIETSDTVRTMLADARPQDAVFLQTAEIEIEEGEPSAAVGEVASILLLPITVTVSARAVTAEDLDDLARQVLGDEQGVGTFIPGTVSAEETGATRIDNAEGTIHTQLRIRGEFARDIDEDAIRDSVKGKSPEDAQSTLAERYGIQDSEVSVTPGWAPWLPRFDFRVTIELKARTPEAETPDEDDENADSDDTPTPEASETPGA